MSMPPSTTVDVRMWLGRVAYRGRLPSIVAFAVALWPATHALAQASHTMHESTTHEMLEDPFNRAVLLDRLEAGEQDSLHWDFSLWAGRAANRLTVRSEGERRQGATEHAELQLLWTRPVARWWDLVAGARTDFEPGASRNLAAIGVQGLAPYRFEIEATAFVGQSGAAAARFEGEYELLVTHRLILQPRVELNWEAQDDPARGLGSGLVNIDAGVRLRYEFRREIAPYIGLVRSRRFGGTADFARAAGYDTDDTSLVAGIRLRF